MNFAQFCFTCHVNSEQNQYSSDLMHVASMIRITEAVHVLFVLIQIHHAISEILVQPRDTEAVVGQMTYLNCSTSLPSKGILWYQYPVGGSESNYIYLLGKLQPPYDEKFKLETDSSKGEFNLIIPSVEMGNAGKYVCQEEGEQGQHRIADLIVLDANPVCGSNIKEDGVIGNNSCDVKPEEFQLTCSVSFHGNIPPVVEWSEVGKYDTIDEGVHQETSARHVASILTMSGHNSLNVNGSSFACQTRRSTTEQNRCISDANKIIYVYKTVTSAQAAVGEHTTCLANSSQPCAYKWKWSDDKKEEIASNAATITFSKPGSYVCEAECKLKQKTCSVLVKVVHVSSVTHASEGTVAVVVVTSVITGALTILVMFFIQNWCNRQRRSNESTEEKHQLLNRIEIYGLAMLNEELYISRIHFPEVEVYDALQFALRRRWRVQDLQTPTDLICNGNHLCLFDFKDLGQDCEIFTVTSAGELVNKWSVGNNWGTISTSNDSNVILIGYTANRLFEYSSDGQLLRQIVLAGADILNPWHAIKLTDDKYVVCYGRYGLKHHRVCIVSVSDIHVDKEGVINISNSDVIRTFGGEKGSSPTEMDVPMRLAVGANGSIYVADNQNGRILKLDCELKLIKELVSAKEHGLRRPRRLHLDEAKDRLLVSDYFRVLVCDLSRNRRQWFEINPGNEL